MAAWKQIVFTLVILVVAAAAWARFYPGAPEILARWGIDWAYGATAKTEGTAAAGGNRQGGRGQQTAVITAPVTSATINDRLQAIGTGRANASVAINPYSSGRLTELTVTPGSKVEAGAVIARLDSDGEKIALDRAKVAVADAQSKADRAKTLRGTNTVTAVQVSDAQLALDNAQLALQEAQLALERRAIVAPISGFVGILPIEAGNYVTTTTTVATIDDRSSIIIDFWVPERFTTAVAVGQPLTATPIAMPGQTFKGTVSAVDNRLEEASRTLLVRAKIENVGDKLRAGMSFQVAMGFPGDTYPSVDPLAIQWGTDGAFVWAIQSGKAKRTPVRIIQRNSESVLIDAPIMAGDIVVTEGVHAVREGADVLIAGAEPRTATPAPAGSGS
ncbi:MULTISPECIES: efflux RND transporter periplasmic adaptor subunit [unclassified Mesorhizobium]|uniref:efflux RND transporter periplasmic adaptor subunit n=1 Tax=unclassified Mesorhizobium TaxID=325217 RepID=UPI0008EB2F90|nr:MULTISPECIES: efflux RND transporter periplasmic adaptor subunit [unclassified Mesorhizobium]RJG44010.1 efflux RND transporter periplasmic adaptor subunit [Mesorhizobium sp. DCY119]SFU06772.1 RND family efflux transporter, MFP subunit [Mesorhizobium sp. YR577]